MINDIGVDIVNIEKLNNVINTKPNFLKKVFTENELKLANKSKDSLEFYAGRFAAKEAIFKAFGPTIEFCDIEILRDTSGKPIPKILNHPNVTIKLSLSHDGNYAIAFCIMLS